MTCSVLPRLAQLSALVALSAFAVTATSPAAAQMRMNQQGSGRPISFAFGGGASVPIGTYKDALKAGWNGGHAVLTSRENTTRVPSGVHDGAWNGPVAPPALPGSRSMPSPRRSRYATPAAPR